MVWQSLHTQSNLLWSDFILFYSDEIKTQGIHIYADIKDNYKLKNHNQNKIIDNDDWHSLTRICILKIMKQLLIIINNDVLYIDLDSNQGWPMKA